MKRSIASFAFFLLIAPAGLLADDLDDALQALKQAEPSKDAAKIKQLAATVHTLARKAQEPPAADTDKEAFEARANYAKDVDNYSEYALYALALQSDSKTAADVLTALETQNPKSKYLEMPDALLLLADNALTRKQPDRALTYANRILGTANKKPPEGIAAADWDRSRNAAMGRAYYVVGSISCDRNQYKAADTNLRAALPSVKGNNAAAGVALFCLGVANYNLGKMTMNKAKMMEAVEFSKQSAAIPGPMQDQAYRNSMLIKAEADRMR